MRLGPSVLTLCRQQDEAADTDALVEAGLTPRQAEVLITLTRTGGSNNALVRELGISESIAKKHLEGCFRELRESGSVTHGLPAH
ncbi:hypothetical protein [Salinibacterium sp. PAMC 21357]|uniref:hypothetical protein n=1 Tax=Salinibacterium sp. PAMC 21357 TaxID=1112215 RepID=UPI000474A4F4|nr:hypothetical protein [Salinibacterium sp. PAMC 21357]